MFDFFKTKPVQDDCLYISPYYWGEKLEYIDRNGGYLEFSESRFKRAVFDDLVEWIRENRYGTTKEERRDLWEDIVDNVIDADSDRGGYRQQVASHDFTHHVNDEAGSFEFYDLWENDLEEHTFRYIWCLYAIVWGIQQYDKIKSGQ